MSFSQNYTIADDIRRGGSCQEMWVSFAEAMPITAEKQATTCRLLLFCEMCIDQAFADLPSARPPRGKRSHGFWFAVSR
jgi:hypothetical protein